MCVNKLQGVLFKVYIKLQVLDFAGVCFYGNTPRQYLTIAYALRNPALSGINFHTVRIIRAYAIVRYCRGDAIALKDAD